MRTKEHMFSGHLFKETGIMFRHDLLLYLLFYYQTIFEDRTRLNFNMRFVCEGACVHVHACTYKYRFDSEYSMIIRCHLGYLWKWSLNIELLYEYLSSFCLLFSYGVVMTNAKHAFKKTKSKN